MQRDPAGGPVGERDVPIALERTMQDLYAGSLARTSFTLVMLAIAGAMALRARRHRDLRRHRVRRVAADAGNRHSVGARRRAAAARDDVPAARARAQRRGRRASASSRPLALGRSMSSLLFGIEPTGPRGLCRGDRRHPRGRGARELPAGAARGDDRSHRDAEGGVAEDVEPVRATRRSLVSESLAARPRWWRRRSSSSASSPQRHASPHRHQPQAPRLARAE